MLRVHSVCNIVALDWISTELDVLNGRINVQRADITPGVLVRHHHWQDTHGIVIARYECGFDNEVAVLWSQWIS